MIDPNEIASYGRMGDDSVAHMRSGEMVVPVEVQEANPGLADVIDLAIAGTGGDPERYRVGTKANSINPETGLPEFFFRKIGGWLGFNDGGAAKAAARRAEEAEAARVSRIQSGTSQINDIFSKFDDTFFSGIEDASRNFHIPQLDDQFRDANRAAVLALSGNNNLASSSGANRLAQLAKQRKDALARINDLAINAGNSARSDLENSRSSLLSTLSATADPASAAAQAQSRAAILSAPQSFSPLGDVFQKFTAGLANIKQAENAGLRKAGASLFSLDSGGSSREVS